MYVTYTNSTLVMGFSFQSSLEAIERLQPTTLELPHPAIVDLVDGDGIEVMVLLTATPRDAHQICALEHREMLRDCLARQMSLLAELAQRQFVLLEQAIEQAATRGIRERLEDGVHAPENMQALACMSIPAFSACRPVARTAPRRAA